MTRACAHCGGAAPHPVRVRLGDVALWVCSSACARQARTLWGHLRKLELWAFGARRPVDLKGETQ